MVLTLRERQARGNENSRITNTLKGLNTFVKAQFPKRDKLYNDLIDYLDSGLYDKWYNEYYLTDDINVLENVPDKIANIFRTFDYCHPSELKSKYKGFHVKTMDGFDVNKL